MNITQEVFHVIANQLEQRSADINAMTATYNSFEQWCTWEAFCACKKVLTWNVLAKPRYSEFDVQNTSDEGDLAICAKLQEGGERWLFAEFVLYHDKKHDLKWRDKLENDVIKLSRIPFVNDVPLLFVIATSTGTIKNNYRWNDQFNRISFMKRSTGLKRYITLPPAGEMYLVAYDILHGDA